MDKLDGIRGLIPFLNYLGSHKIWYRLEHVRDNTIMVIITLIGMRLEVDFFDDHIEYNYYEGDEFVMTDQNKLYDLIKKDIG